MLPLLIVGAAMIKLCRFVSSRGHVTELCSASGDADHRSDISAGATTQRATMTFPQSRWQLMPDSLSQVRLQPGTTNICATPIRVLVVAATLPLPPPRRHDWGVRVGPRAG